MQAGTPRFEVIPPSSADHCKVYEPLPCNSTLMCQRLPFYSWTYLANKKQIQTLYFNSTLQVKKFGKRLKIDGWDAKTFYPMRIRYVHCSMLMRSSRPAKSCLPNCNGWPADPKVVSKGPTTIWIGLKVILLNSKSTTDCVFTKSKNPDKLWWKDYNQGNTSRLWKTA